MNKPTPEERARELAERLNFITAKSVPFNQAIEELTDLFKKSDERDKYTDQLGEIIFAVLESGREVQLYPKDKSAVEIVKAELSSLKHTAQEMAREAVVLRKAYNKIKPKAEAFDWCELAMRGDFPIKFVCQGDWIGFVVLGSGDATAHKTILEAVNKARTAWQEAKK